MKSVAIAVTVVSVLCIPLAAFSQTDATPTLAQVRAELEQLEQVGYDPAKADDASYPNDIQAAEAKLSTQGSSGYGGVPTNSSKSDSRAVVRPASPEDMRQLYFGGQ